MPGYHYGKPKKKKKKMKKSMKKGLLQSQGYY